MKNLPYKSMLVFLSFTCLLLTSCQNNSEETSTAKAPTEIGSAMMEGTSEMTPILVGETSNQAVWLEYIQAHNDRD